MQEMISRPFISHDGKDNNGVRAEVKVQMGYATVSNLAKPKKKDSPSVQFQFTAPNLEHPISGWVDKVQDKEVYEVLKNAYDNDEAAFFRIEVQRKKDIDRTIPMDELAPPKDMQAAFQNTFRSIVAAKKEESDEWIVGSKMITNFKEDSNSLDNANNVFKATDDDIDTSTPKAESKPSKGFTNPSYKVKNNDGTVNTESFALMAPVNMLMFVKKYIKDNLEEDVFNSAEEKKIATGLLKVAGIIQKNVLYTDKEKSIDLGAYSHRITEEIVKGVVLEYMPLKDFSDDFDKELELYLKKVVMASKQIAEWSVQSLDKLQG